MTIGDKIRILREMKGYSQEYMAEQVGMSQTGYSKIERDETDIAFSRLEQIANILEVKPQDLITLDEKFVFNNCQNGVYGIINNGTFTVNERQLFEEKIALLEELLAVYRKLEGK